MTASTRAVNSMDSVMVRESSVMQMEVSMRGAGNKEQWMAMENYTILMRSLLMTANGRKMLFTEKDAFTTKIQCH